MLCVKVGSKGQSSELSANDKQVLENIQGNLYESDTEDDITSNW